jgi:leucyl/phenylalanyl-tRNA--protein transferase
MFSRGPDASKIALVALCRLLNGWGFELLDCQVGNPHLFRMGAVEISREAFEDWLEYLLARQQPAGAWTERAVFQSRW